MKKVTIWMGSVLLLSALVLLAGCRGVQLAKPQPSQEASRSASEAASESEEDASADVSADAEESAADSQLYEISEASESSEVSESSETFESSETSESSDLFPETQEAYFRALYPEAAAKLDEIGWDLRTAYDWVAAFHYVEEDPIDWELGTKWYAQLGFETGRGHCYTFAAMMTEFARLLGYEARQVAGNLIGNNPFHHSWVEIDIDGTTYVLDPEVQQEWNQDCYLVIYGTDEAIPYDVDALTYMPDDPTPQSLERLALSGWDPDETEEEYDPNTGCFGD